MKKCFYIILISILFSQISLAKISEANLEKLAKHYSTSQVVTNDPWVLYNLAMTYAYTGYVEEGFSALTKIHKLDKGFKQKVLKRYKRKTNRYPNNWENQFYYAFALYFNENKTDSVETFKKVTDLTDDLSVQGWSYGYIAYIMGERQDWDQALHYVNKAIKKEPEGAALYFAKSIALKETGDRLGATAALLKAGVLQAKQIMLKKRLQLKHEESS